MSDDAPFPPGLLAVPLPVDREREVWAAFAPILAEIIKLREVDLTDVHPVVVFVPANPGQDGED